MRKLETYKEQILTVEEIADQIGYGHLMHIASALWREKLKNSGVPDNGAFFPTLEFCMKQKEMTHVRKDKELYDGLIKNAKNHDNNNSEM